MSKQAKKLHIKTYGCQMNVYDSQRMQGLLEPIGYEASESVDNADMVVLNTCHIREKAAEKVYSELGRIRQEKERLAKEEGKKMIIAVAGCVGQAEGDEIFKRAPFVDIVVGPQSYQSLPDMVANINREAHKKHLIDLDFPEEDKFDALPAIEGEQSVSAFLSIQEGCDKFCTFCVVPYTRGAEYSRPVSAIYREAVALVAGGAKEINLLGQNVNAYHGETSEGEVWGLAQLIKHIAKIDGLERILYTTSHPRDMSEDLIELHGTEPKLIPYLHLPVQSGSDNILKTMNRKHTAKHYIGIIEKLRKSKPDLQFSCDFIVGFPGETDQDFEDTLALVREVNYAQAYSFKYSPRPGTPAATHEEQVPEDVKSERLQRLQALLNEQQEAFNKSCVGKTLPVLFMRKGKHEHQISGRSPYMQSVNVIDEQDQYLNTIQQVKITEAFANSLQGEVVPA